MGEQKTDRSGEPFQNDFTTNEAAHPPARDSGAQRLNMTGEQVDSQADDAKNKEFAEELKGTNINKQPAP